MKTRQPPQSHRFVVVYRNEHREIEGAADIWRGWVERIPNPRQRELERQRAVRPAFPLPRRSAAGGVGGAFPPSGGWAHWGGSGKTGWISATCQICMT